MGRSRRTKATSAQMRFVWATTNPFGDPITLSRKNWTEHIETEHPEMAGRASDLRFTAENPESIRESLATEQALIYEKTFSTNELMRAVVYHEDPQKALTGGTECRIGTAYLRDEKRYPSPKIGKIVWPPEKVGGGK